MDIMSQSVLKIACVLSVFQLTQACKIVVYNGSIDNNVTFACSDASQICSSGLLNMSRETIAVTNAYSGYLTYPGPRGIMNAAIEKGYNCLGLDWSPPNGYVAPLDFPIVTLQAVLQLTEAFKSMRPCLPPDLLHLIGISVGAQICCAVAKAYGQYANSPVNRITGCDISKVKGIFQDCDATCASQVVHLCTDPYYYGDANPKGTVVVWFNRDTYDQSYHQPGCLKPYPDYLINITDRNKCSHQRGGFFEAFIIQTNGTCSFMATKASSKDDWIAGRGESVLCLDNINKTITGTFYIRTSANEPYWLGAEGATAAP